MEAAGLRVLAAVGPRGSGAHDGAGRGQSGVHAPGRGAVLLKQCHQVRRLVSRT